MLFCVKMTVNLPHDLDQGTLDGINDGEHARAKALQEQGKWLHLWRVAGRFENVSVFSVDDPGELHDLLSSLPLYPYMTIEVTALCRHPGAIAFP
jgi:muconolactone D-isomerase